MVVRPSPYFAALLLLLHTMASMSVYAASMPFEARLAIILLILLSLLYYMARDVLLLLPGSWCKIALNQNTVSVVSRDGSNFIGEVANKTIANPYFVVLRIRSDSYRFPVSRAIFPDALGSGEFRDLCVRLKFS